MATPSRASSGSRTTRAPTTPMDPGDRRRLRDDGVRGDRDVVPAAGGDVAHAGDERLLGRELDELVVDAVARERAAAGRVDVQDDAAHARVGARDADRGDDALVDGHRSGGAARVARDGAVHADDAR